ncbi:hypothetical protein [Promicromonospora umidemergens]|nr:hypothetical protein [Promicromonospora umidemergens]
MISTITTARPNGIVKFSRSAGGLPSCTCHARAISSGVWAGFSPTVEW